MRICCMLHDTVILQAECTSNTVLRAAGDEPTQYLKTSLHHWWHFASGWDKGSVEWKSSQGTVESCHHNDGFTKPASSNVMIDFVGPSPRRSTNTAH